MKKNFYTLILSTLLITNLNAQSNNIGAGISLGFDGNTGNYVELGDVFNSLTFPFSLEAWVNSHGYSAGKTAIFSSDNDLINATGVWIGFTPSGQVLVEFGDGLGNDSLHMKRYVTDYAVPVDKWSQIAVVCTDINTVTVYISGMPQITNATGAYAGTTLAHSAAPASIGRHLGLNESWFNGELDEIRLWSNNLSQKTIRNKLCRKINTSPAKLIGYWTSDESYSSTTVEDHTSPSENGVVTGTVTKLTSSAPIGDDQKQVFTSNWFEVEVVIEAYTGDKLKTQNITGDGIYVYRVDAYPYNATGLTYSPAYYFGVFCIDVTTSASYNMRYKYFVTDGVVTNDNESSVTLMNRNNATQSWTDINGILDINKNWITKHDGISKRGEYTINVSGVIKQSEPVSLVQAAAKTMSIYPNPACNFIHLQLSGDEQSVISVRILNEEGMVIKVIQEMEHSNGAEVPVADLTSGIYLADVFTSYGHIAKSFVVQK